MIVHNQQIDLGNALYLRLIKQYPFIVFRKRQSWWNRWFKKTPSWTGLRIMVVKQHVHSQVIERMIGDRVIDWMYFDQNLGTLIPTPRSWENVEL